MGGTALHACILTQWFEMLLLLFKKKIRYYGRQWDFIWYNETSIQQKLYPVPQNVFDHFFE